MGQASTQRSFLLWQTPSYRPAHIELVSEVISDRMLTKVRLGPTMLIDYTADGWMLIGYPS